MTNQGEILQNRIKEILGSLNASQDKQIRLENCKQLLAAISDLNLLRISRTDDDITPVIESLRASVVEVIQVIEGTFLPFLEKYLTTTWYVDEWTNLCRYRSSLEAIFDLFGQSDAPLKQFHEELSYLDEMIQDKGSREAAPIAVKNKIQLLENHWWWRINENN